MIKKLSELNIGERGIVVNIVGKGALIRRLLDMGIVRGVEVRVIRKAPLGDPIEFEIKGYYLSLRRDEARHVFVEVVK
ncbi:MAG: ferrous iron transport protein A [Thermofilum sp. ex4484_79]|nr:MAG: ferrous iron transport protein A [Thermofilum sp. ex4484_79]